MRLLSVLIGLLFPPRETEVLIQNVHIEHLPLSPISIAGEAFSAIALLPYKEARVHALILEAKFHGNTRAVAILGEALGEYMREELSDSFECSDSSTVLVPIPLGKKRLRLRGYNQVERIARSALSFLPGASIETEVLFRTRETREQTSLSGKERIENMHGAFGAKGVSPDVDYILVDDVITTGTTLFEACKAMKEAGATNVRAIALAH